MEEIERKANTIGMQKAFANEMGLGLNKREWFAGMALQGILANSVEVVKSPFAEMYALQAADEILKQLAESDGAK
jgi:hypothetical protein